MRDLVIGMGIRELIDAWEYPAEACLSVQIPTCSEIYHPGPIDPQLVCDVSYVSHQSAAPERLADALLAEWGAFTKSKGFDLRCILQDLFGRARRFKAACPLRSDLLSSVAGPEIDESGPWIVNGRNFATEVYHFHDVSLRQAVLETVSAMPVTFRIYGRGWEDHPRLARFAAGPADNGARLAAIYRSSAINLQVIDGSPMHQRLVDGLFCEGFFLVCDTKPPSEYCGRLAPLARWLQHWTPSRDTERFLSRMPSEVLEALNELTAGRFDRAPADVPAALLCDLLADMRERAAWDPRVFFQDFDQVAFSSPDELRRKIERYLREPDLRRALAASMREAIHAYRSYDAFAETVMDFVAERAVHGAAPE